MLEGVLVAVVRIWPGSLGRLIAALAVATVLAGAAPALAQAGIEDVTVSDTLHVVRLADGSTLRARVVAVEGDRLVLMTEAGVRVELERAQVASIRPAAEADVTPDPNTTRLFFAPTGRAVAGGSGYAGLFELFLPFVSYGVTDWLTISGGTPILPGAMGEFFYLAPKVQVFSSERLNASAGVLAFYATGDLDAGSAGILYGVSTWGGVDEAVTVGFGFPFVGDNLETSDGVLMAGGELRAGGSVKLITENYLFPAEGAVVSGGLRLFGERFSGDLGVGMWLGGDDSGCCLPIINLVYSFGGRRD